MFNELKSISVALLKQWLFVSLMPSIWYTGTFQVPVLSESVLKGMPIKTHLETMISLGFLKVHLIYKLLHVFYLDVSMEYGYIVRSAKYISWKFNVFFFFKLAFVFSYFFYQHPWLQKCIMYLILGFYVLLRGNYCFFFFFSLLCHRCSKNDGKG